MNNQDVRTAFGQLSTPLVADACLRLGMPLRLAAPGIRPLSSGSRVAGRVLPARHYGSVDIFLEAMGSAGQGDVLVIDNGGRTDEACIGDLTVLEARACGLAGIVVWGCLVQGSMNVTCAGGLPSEAPSVFLDERAALRQ